jgi:hypothetical protein
MRALTVALGLSLALTTVQIANAEADEDFAGRKTERYSEFYLDLSPIAGRKDYAQIVNSLHRQIDIVTTVGLSPRILKFFRSIPIVVDETACLGHVEEGAEPNKKSPTRPGACFSKNMPTRLQDNSHHGTFWDSKKSEWVNADPLAFAEDMRLGLIAVRPRVLPEVPLLLHELLHAYHADVMERGFNNKVIAYYFDQAKSKSKDKDDEASKDDEAKSKDDLYVKGAYLLTNDREFFAVTASVFLFGKDGQEPFTREKIKKTQPEYYQWLVWLFGFDPGKPTLAPVASAN